MFSGLLLNSVDHTEIVKMKIILILQLRKKENIHSIIRPKKLFLSKEKALFQTNWTLVYEKKKKVNICDSLFQQMTK